MLLWYTGFRCIGYGFSHYECSLSHHGAHFFPVCIGSGFKECVECRSNFCDHVSGCGRAAVLLEGLVVALPCKGARTEGSQEERAETICFLRSSVECPVHQNAQGA